MITPATLLTDLLAFKQDALAFFQTKPLYETGITTFDLGLRRVRVISAAPLAQAILTSESFERGQRPYGPLGTFAGQGSLRWLIGPTLPVLDDDLGLERRHTVRPLHVNIARGLKVRPLPSTPWPRLADGEHDLYTVVTGLVFDLLCEALFGRTYPEEREHMAQTIHEATDALDQLSKSLQPYACKYGGQARVLRGARASLARFAARAIEELRKSDEGEDAPPMAALLATQLDEMQLIDEVITHIIAGLETTTITCCWALTQLMRHPDYLSALRAQGSNSALARWCVLETMRQYPAFWTLIRVAKQDLELEGARISQGDVIFVSPLLIHHNPEYWPQPERFWPERHRERQRVHPADFMPFGFGARSCIGAQLSSAIVGSVIEGFAQADEAMSLIDDPQRDPKIIVLKSRNGFRLRVGPSHE